jgi:membrane protein required for colicin V production
MNDWPQLALFNAFDWFVVVVCLASALLSLWRGFVREAISLGGWVLAFIAANLGAITVANAIGDLIANATGRYIVAWSLVFLVVLALSSIAAKVISKLIAASGLGVLDRMLGSVFGLLRGVLIVLALVFVLRQLVPESEQSLLRDSQLMPHIDMLLGWSTRIFEEFKAMEIPGITA